MQGSMRVLLALAGLSVLAVAGCDSSGSGSNMLPIPPKGFVADAAQGKRLFARHCTACHGRDLRGSRTGPPLLHKYYEPDHHSDLSFYMAVSKGVRQHHWQFGNMPPVSGVSPEQAGHIVAYVREEQRKVGIF